jgi:hypothetical protein
VLVAGALVPPEFDATTRKVYVPSAVTVGV